MNIKKYIDGQFQTENGSIWRKEDYKNAKPDEIVYIGEYDLDTLEEYYDKGQDLTDEEIIEKQIGDTRNTIRQTIKEYYPNATDEWIDKHHLIDVVIEACSWESCATTIDQIDDWGGDIWDDYPEE